MVVHLVFWKMKPTAPNGKTAVENAQEMVRLLNGLKGVVPELKELSVGVDFNRTDAAWDVALYTTFASKEDLNAYQANADHKKVVAFVVDVVASRAVVDYEI